MDRIRTIRASSAAALFAVATAAVAAAQPTLSASTTNAVPGAAVTLTVNGSAGQHFAIVASSVGSGLSYGGVALSVGTDVTIVVTGVLGGSGSASVGFVPPFRGTTLDRYYLQAVVSTSPSFVPLQPSAGVVIHNRDAVHPPPRLGMNSSTITSTLSTGANYVLSTPAFVAETNATCHVSAAVQIVPGSPVVPIGSSYGYMRVAVSRNGLNLDDGVRGQYIISNGLATKQPLHTRTATVSVAAGQTIRFGAFLGTEGINPNGAVAEVHTSYICF